ncbi:MAG: hypothetical protein HGA62_07815 [Chlorobiaceae bacterium]|nr:hypothetical protein [Chlorobiaceae bacterium]NTV60156.1 hypothetical protein [Chlorobiaceae bacterium]
MSWVVLFIISILLFVFLVTILRVFVGHMKKAQNLEIESFKQTMIDPDNPVGLRGEELENMKRRQEEAQRHLREVISKIPVVQKDGRFQIDEEELRRRKETAAGNGVSGKVNNDIP